MKCDKKNMLLYAVTDRAWVGKQTLCEQVEAALKGGCTCVQLREKELSDAEFFEEAVKIHEICKHYGVPFIVNDNVDIAVERVGDDMIIGVSAHTVEEAVEAVKNGADYLGAGAVFGSSTKQNAGAMKKETLRSICEAVDIPVVAIGGINDKNIKELSHTGIDGVALVSAIFAADDIENTCRALRNLTEESVKSK